MNANAPIEKFFRLTAVQKQALKKLGLVTIKDLLYHFPVRYGARAEAKHISHLTVGDYATVYGRIKNLKKMKGWKSKIPMTKAQIEDATGTLHVVWFHQPYIATMLQEGAFVHLKGKIQKGTQGLYMANPEQDGSGASTGTELFDKKNASDTHIPLDPYYPESRGITSRWFYHALKKIFSRELHKKLEDPLPQTLLKKYNLPTLQTALVWIHTPRKAADALAARKRFSFEEVFFIQLSRLSERNEHARHTAFAVTADHTGLDAFMERFPFTLTDAQKRAINTILDDFKKVSPMSRLLEGDVGSGKTAVATTTAYAVATSRPPNPAYAQGYGKATQDFGNLQVAYMAPTEILAQQHFESFIELFSAKGGPASGGNHSPLQIGLITGSGCRKFPSKVSPSKSTTISRTQLLQWVANGEIPILIGTHTLIQKTVKFRHLAYVIIDEQHRFGTSQRFALARGKHAEQTRNDAENSKTDPLLYRDLTYRIRNALFSVRKELGGGHKEIVYQRAVAEELEKAKLNHKREIKIPILYNKKQVGTYQPDFVVEDKVILELKALAFIGSAEKKQLWTYLKGAHYKLALLANFGPRDLTVDRVVYDLSRQNSASVPHSPAFVPHLLSMTATPIPRTLALTIYGDLDLTLLDEMPPGRKPIMTKIVSPKDRESVYEHIHKELGDGRQAYIICPKIEIGKGKLEVKNVEDEAKRLKKEYFPHHTIEVLHSKIKPKEKEEIMQKFLNHETDILVATSVVEVGVNIPNATTIVIEGAERFGLAQLHQLRGRVLRSTHQAYCYLLSEHEHILFNKRAQAVEKAKNGFELAELDLKLRGAGVLTGEKQWGITDVGMEALQNIKMIEAARHEAQAILANDPDLSKSPLIQERLGKIKDKIHFE